MIALFLIVFTVPDLIIHILFFSIRADVLETFPMVGEAISEGFNVVFALAIIIAICNGFEKDKPIYHLITGGVLFYISLLHDFLDEFFVLTVPSIAFEVFAFPLALIFATIGIYKSQQYERSLYLDNERLKLQYKEMSITDNLTCLYNTRYFYDTVPTEIETMLHENRPLSLLILDIDDFKLVNDTYGHLEGDRLIEYIGKQIKTEFSSYQCYRYGGEEFIVVLEDVDLDRVYEMADSFRMKFASDIFYIDGESYQKTISVGLAELTDQDDTKTLLEKADKAMYVAKTTGKNKVCY